MAEIKVHTRGNVPGLEVRQGPASLRLSVMECEQLARELIDYVLGARSEER